MKIVLELKQVRFKLKYCIEIAFLFTISGNQVEVKRVILKCIYLIQWTEKKVIHFPKKVVHKKSLNKLQRKITFLKSKHH